MKRFCLKAPEKGSTFEHAPTGRRARFNGHSVDGDTFLLTDSTGQRTEVRGDDFEWHLVPTANDEIPRFGTVLYDVEAEKEIIFLFQCLNSIGITSTSDRQIHLLPLHREQVWFETSRSYPELKEFFLALNEQTNQSNSESDEGLRQVHMLNLYRKGDELFSRICQDQNSLSLSEKAERDDAKLRLALEKAELQKALERPVLKEMLEGFNTNFESTKLSSLKLNNGIIDKKRFDLEAAKFVTSWFEHKYPNQIPPDMDQARAIASTRASQLLVARAGSGKTSTIIKRIVFWTQHCGVDPREIMVLAFNKKAATEVEERYRTFMHLDDDAPVPHIMTFHAMARAFSPEIDVENNSEQVLQKILLDLVKDEAYFEQFRTIMRSYFSADLKFFEENGMHLPQAEALKIRRGNVDIALAGHETKSIGEHLIANQLFEYGIPYTYEKLWHWDGRPYSPDFTIYLRNGGHVVIEYFGMAADNSNTEYLKQIEKKRKYFEQRHDSTLFEYYPHDITRNGPEAFKQKIIQDLENLGFILEKLTDEEVWKRIEDRALAEFTNVSKTLVGRFRKAGLTPDDVDFRLVSYKDSFENETLFLRLVNESYRRYLNTLAMNGSDDFDGFMERASSALRSGISEFERRSGLCNLKKLKQIYIDEFQDFSHLFAEMLDATLNVTENMGLFCVGDNWQAINGFAGSDLRFFDSFEASYSDSVRLISAKNYRSCASIVNLGNALMQGLGAPATVGNVNIGYGLVSTIDLSDLGISTAERARFGDDDLLALILRIFSDVIKKDGDLVLLSRTNTVPSAFGYASDNGYVRTLDGLLKRIRKFIPEELRSRVKISTTHGFKGLEAHTVIVIDVFKRRYPLLHPRLKFIRFSGLTEEQQIAEDRRLFYVAVTRAKHQLFLITDSRRTCEFLEMNALISQIPRLDLEKLPEWHFESPNALIILSNVPNYSGTGTFDLRDQIKASGYRWRDSSNPLNKGWIKKIEKAQFNIESIQTEVWFRLADGVKVRLVDSGSNESIDEREIFKGSWKT